MAGAVGIEPTLPGWPVSATLPKLTPRELDLYAYTCYILFIL